MELLPKEKFDCSWPHLLTEDLEVDPADSRCRSSKTQVYHLTVQSNRFKDLRSLQTEHSFKLLTDFGIYLYMQCTTQSIILILDHL